MEATKQKLLEEYIIENDRLRQRISELERLLDRIHESREHWKQAEQDAAALAYGMGKLREDAAAWSGAWKRACKVWRHRAKNEQKMVNERDIELSDLRTQLSDWQLAAGSMTISYPPTPRRARPSLSHLARAWTGRQDR